jgi:adenine-specific DNA methylase
MRINLKLKPSVYTGKTLNEVMSKFRTYSWKWGNLGRYKKDSVNKNSNIVVYNLIKENAKYQQIRYKTGEKKGRYKESKLIKSKKWTAYVYKINEKFAEAINLKVYQNNRNFKYEIKK